MSSSMVIKGNVTLYISEHCALRGTEPPMKNVKIKGDRRGKKENVDKRLVFNAAPMYMNAVK